MSEMTMPTPGLDIQAVEDLIRQCLSAMKAQGIRITPDRYGIMHYGGCWQLCPEAATSVCLISAVVLVRQPKILTLYAAEAFRHVTGLTAQQIRGLTAGFDDLHLIGDGDPDYYTLGAQFRREYDAGLLNPADPDSAE